MIISEETLKEKLIDFSKKYSEIIIVTKGVCPEEGHKIYYFITNEKKYFSELEDVITDLDLELYNQGFDCTLFQWPDCSISDYPFLGDIIWKAD